MIVPQLVRMAVLLAVCATALAVSPQDRSAVLINKVAKALRAPESGAFTLAATFRQDEISWDEVERVRVRLQERPLQGQAGLLGYLDRFPRGLAIQEREDNSTVQHLVFMPTGQYYLKKFTGAGLGARAFGKSEWTHFGNGKRVLVVTAKCGSAGKALLSNQPEQAPARLWMNGLAFETLSWLELMVVAGDRRGLTWSCGRDVLETAARLFGARFPLWESLVFRVSLSLLASDSGAVFVRVSMFDSSGRPLVEREAVLGSEGKLRSVRNTMMLPTSDKVFSEHGAYALEYGCLERPQGVLSALVASQAPYVIDLTDKGARLYYDESVPDDVLRGDKQLQAWVDDLVGESVVAGAGGGAQDAELKASHANLRVFPQDARIGRIKKDLTIQGWIVNAGDSPVKITEIGASCGCLEPSVESQVLSAWSVTRCRILVRQRELPKVAGAQTLTLYAESETERSRYVWRYWFDGPE